MTLAEGCLVHKNVSYERLSLVIPLTMADSVLYPETSRLYMAGQVVMTAVPIPPQYAFPRCICHT